MSNVTVKTAVFESKEQSKSFDRFISEYLPGILEEAQYDELFGYQLTSSEEYYDKDVADALIFKFLKANDFVLEATKEQLLKALIWRKNFNPLSAAFNETHDSKFDAIGILTNYPESADNTKVITWNLYGAAGNPKELFKDLEKFIRYRIGLMERGVQLLDFTDPSNCYLTQVHDYKGVSFLRLDPDIKKGTKATIQIFQDYYPELLYKKFFTNIPTVLFWVFEFIKRFLPVTTTKKFFISSDCSKIHKDLGDAVPKVYGGKGEELDLQNVKEIKPPVYGAHLSQQLFTNEVD